MKLYRLFRMKSRHWPVKHYTMTMLMCFAVGVALTGDVRMITSQPEIAALEIDIPIPAPLVDETGSGTVAFSGRVTMSGVISVSNGSTGLSTISDNGATASTASVVVVSTASTLATTVTAFPMAR